MSCDLPGAQELSPETLLEKAIGAQNPCERERLAREGLALCKPRDWMTRALLIRQLYIAHMERGEYSEALACARKVVELRVLDDVGHQDASRVLVAMNETDQAVGHLRMAARCGPPHR
ncbi:MAG: tetratricopeptide repeat protein, partial [Polyangiaceae bacterium]|nr:tetratricopeptide repeat protein [Polyangiaceae bacterium]